MGLTPGGWHGRRVLLTGHTGFKGAWLRLWLEALGADVTGVALAAEPGSMHQAVGAGPAGGDVVLDIRDADALAALTADVRPEVVLHLAAQAFVRRSYVDPIGTFSSNVMGTLNVLEALDADVTGVALAAEPGAMHQAVGAGPAGGDVVLDIRDADALAALTADVRPEAVLHLAAQAFVRRSYVDPIGTFSSNVMGTLNVLEAARRAGTVGAVVVVTSDKVYENDGSGRAFCESDALGGADPYSAPKAAAELAVRSWRAAHHGPTDPAAATARAGNVIGGGDIGEDRLVPDALRALVSGRPLRLRHPGATRPWQFVLEPLYGYLLLAEALLDRRDGTPPAVNFGPVEPELKVSELVDLLFARMGQGGWELDPGHHPHEAPALRIDPSLAADALGWRPVLSTEDAVDLTLGWHRAQEAGDDLRALAVAQIEAYAVRVAEVGAVAS